MNDCCWSSIDSLSLGKCAEYYAHIEFIRHGYRVYMPAVDNHGVDFIAMKGEEIKYVQVKSVRENNYTFIKKNLFKADDEHVLFYIRFVDGSLPEMYIIPGSTFKNINNEDGPFKDYEYNKEGRKSKPEYGISVAKNNLGNLGKYKSISYFEGGNRNV